MTIGNAATEGPGAPDSGNLSNIRWTDKSFPASRSQQGALSKPNFDFVNVGLLFPQNDPSEIIYINDQMDHRKKLDTNLNLHVHFIQNSVNVPTFKVDYRFYNNGDPVPLFTTLSTDDGDGIVFPYVSGSILQIIPFPEIPHPIPEKISSNIDMKFYRDDNLVVGDVLVKFVDYHYQMDSDGSRQPFAK